ncbi:MAG: hypothetical protein SOZ00_01250 [Tidjanibacter sp.]|nr:hypothetical protein [Tidjanibacter sp.]
MTVEEITAEIERHPWYSAARCLAADAGVATADAYRLSRSRRSRRLPLKEVRFDHHSDENDSSTIAIIDEFISSGCGRVTVDAQTPDEIALLNSDSNDTEFASEELAQIYSSQGLFDAAEEIYRLLSLQEPKKSIYFAELIETLERQRLKSTSEGSKKSEENN